MPVSTITPQAIPMSPLLLEGGAPDASKKERALPPELQKIVDAWLASHLVQNPKAPACGQARPDPAMAGGAPLPADAAPLTPPQGLHRGGGVVMPGVDTPDAHSKLRGAIAPSEAPETVPAAYDDATPTEDCDCDPAPPYQESDPAPAADGEMSRDEAIAVLARHQEDFKKPVDDKGIQKLIDDKDTPTDEKRALRALQNDKGLEEEIDGAKNGKIDGKYSAEDINKLAQTDAVRAYSAKHGDAFENNYIPSDTKEQSPQGRPMTANDAQRELMLYSEELPGHISAEDLRKIGDGTAKMDKCPPQLQAAARYYSQHPDEREKDLGIGDKGSARKDGVLNKISKSVELTADEHKTLDTIRSNQGIFFPNGIMATSDKLNKIANDETKSPEVRDAAKDMSNEKCLLFRLADNGKHGHGGNVWDAANDKKFSAGDITALAKNMNQTVAPDEKALAAAAPASSRDSSAVNDMKEGLQNQPDAVKKQGGGLKDFVNFVAKAYSAVQSVVSDVASAIAKLKIPVVSWLAGGVAIESSLLSGAAKTASAELEGKDVKKAARDAGFSTLATAVGLAIPGGKAAAEAASNGVVKEGSKKWSEQAVMGSATTNGELASAAGKAGATGVGKEGGMAGLREWGETPTDGAGSPTNGDVVERGVAATVDDGKRLVDGSPSGQRPA